MDFSLTEDQKMLRTTIRDFAEKELEPIAAEIDEESRFPAESIPKAAAIGLTGIGYPEKYGGSGGGAAEQVIAFEEVARVCAATSVILMVTNELAAYPVSIHGT
jgi:alkylation response protein AidB-like acyl-CoA dehydrogenase